MPTPCPPNTACKWRRGVQRLMQKHLHVGLILQPLRFSLLFGEGDIAVVEPDRHRTGTGQNGLRLSIEGCPALIRLIGERRFRITRLVCNECERDELMYFDVTAALH